ncbi:MAG: sigma factor-like helix-turn-helix DNA-binding protein [Beijerinckiaceae bacterium]|nr:sigma factor-like helix-turn-helix DNA-binding protein [Beijerinckiaceae bacterium]
MKLREDLNAMTPRLRRYARALMSGHPGGSDSADDLVRATLTRALGFRNHGTQADLMVRLYATLIQLNRDIVTGESKFSSAGKSSSHAQPLGGPAASLAARPGKLATSLMSLALEEREALLLVALDNFDQAEAARILRISRAAFLSRLTRARLALESQLRTQPARAPDDHDRHHSHLRLVK